VNCDRSRQLLALDVSGDLAGHNAHSSGELHAHLETCPSCTEFFDHLDRNQTLLRGLRRETVPSAALAQMRQGLFTRLEGETPGWGVRLERFLFGEFRKPRYAILCLLLLAIVSATVFAQFRNISVRADAVAGLVGSDRLRLPSDFSNWTLVGTSMQFSHSGANLPQRIYVNPEGYREYKRTGHFPEGTVLVLESAATVAASVKDRRFADGWGYFQFGNGHQTTREAVALPATAGCLACHRDQGAKDHVFTQFYPVLRAALGVL
jgi:hypothetical protein